MISSISYYVLPPPIIRDGRIFVPASDITKIEIVSPNTPEDDMETLMFDPLSGDLYIIEKNHDDPSAHIYKFTPPGEANVNPIVLQEVGKNIFFDFLKVFLTFVST